MAPGEKRWAVGENLGVREKQHQAGVLQNGDSVVSVLRSVMLLCASENDLIGTIYYFRLKN